MIGGLLKSKGGDYFNRVVLPSFVIFFFYNFVFERLSKRLVNCTCLGVKLLHHYLFRVEKGKEYLFRVSNTIAILV